MLEVHPKGSFLAPEAPEASQHEALVHTLQDPEVRVYPEVLDAPAVRVRQRLIEVLGHEGLELLEERHGPLGEQEELQIPQAHPAATAPWLSRDSMVQKHL